MKLKPLDLFVCLKIAIGRSDSWTYLQLAESLGLSASETNAAVKRSLSAGLLVPALDSKGKPGPKTQALLEFIEHGVRYAFFESPGATRRGMPTAHSAPPLSDRIQSDASQPFVWADPEGEVRGQEFRPLYKSAPAAARRDPALYEVLALVDAIRGGRTRERQLGFELLAERLV
ncbi:MAG: hypothetical protein ACI8QC_004510 [Planctomycetota bacterium]|jgi:hypothetical protein